MLFSDIRPFARYVRFMTIGADSHYRPHVPYDARLFYTLSGKGSIETGGKVYNLSKGCVLIINAGQEYYLRPSEHEVTYFAVNFDYTQKARHLSTPIPPESAKSFNPARITCLEAFDDITAFNSIVFLKGMSRLEPKCIQSEHEFVRKLNYCDELNGNLLSEILFECARTVQSQESEGSETVELIIDYIHDNFDRPITNKEIGSVFSFHPNYISSMVRQSTGMPLHKYLTTVRVARSIDLLEEGNYSIGEIAAKCGFQNLYYFSRFFKKTVGVSPTEYRRR